MEHRKNYLREWRRKQTKNDKEQGIVRVTIRAHRDLMPKLRELARADLERRGLA